VRDLVGEHRLRQLGVVVHEAGGEKQRLGVFVQVGADAPGMDQAGGGAAFWGLGHGVLVQQSARPPNAVMAPANRRHSLFSAFI